MWCLQAKYRSWFPCSVKGHARVTSIRYNGIEALAHYFVSQAVFHGRYDVLEEFNVDSKAESAQLRLAHIARNKKCKKEETKTNTSVPLSPVQGQELWRCSRRNQEDYRGKDLWNRKVSSLEFKAEWVIDVESEGGDCDEVICAGWGEPGGDWTEWGWRNEGSWFQSTGKVMHIWRSVWWFVMRKIQMAELGWQ